MAEKNLSRINLTTMKFLLILFLCAPLLGISSVSSNAEYVYYGAVPGKIQFASPWNVTVNIINMSAGFEVKNTTIPKYIFLSVIALTNGTNAQLYTLKDRAWVPKEELSLNTMEKRILTLPNATIFKIVSNQLVSVSLYGEGEPNLTKNSGPTPTTFYPAVDGCYVGKDFMLVASQYTRGLSYRILALEDSEVTVTKEDGTKISFKIATNSYQDLQFIPYAAYRIQSTGNIMVQAGAPDTRTSFFVHAVEDGFVGKNFYSSSINNWDPTEDYGFRISALEDTKVAIWDVVSKSKIQEFTIPAGTGIGIKPKALEIMMQADKPVTVMFVHNGSLQGTNEWGYGAGLTYIGLKPDEEALIYLPLYSNNEAYFFAYEDTVLMVDETPVSIKGDSYFLLLTPGDHRIRADKKMIVELIHWPLIPSSQGIRGWGSDVPCIQTVDAVPNVKLTPLTEEGTPITYIVIGVAVAIIAITVVFMVMKQGKQKGS